MANIKYHCLSNDGNSVRFLNLKRPLQKTLSIENSILLKGPKTPTTKATITRYDLSPRFFCNDATLLYEFESDEI